MPGKMCHATPVRMQAGPPPAPGYRCVCTTGTVRHKAEVQSKSRREKRFTDVSWAPFAAANETADDAQVPTTPQVPRAIKPADGQQRTTTRCITTQPQPLPPGGNGTTKIGVCDPERGATTEGVLSPPSDEGEGVGGVRPVTRGRRVPHSQAGPSRERGCALLRGQDCSARRRCRMRRTVRATDGAGRRPR